MEKASFPQHWLQVFGKFSLDFFVIELGPKSKVLYSGGKASSYFGYPIDVFISQLEGSFLDLVREADQTRVTKAICEAKKAEADIDLQFHLICFDRSVCQIHVEGTYLYSSEGLPTYLFLISDEKSEAIASDFDPECFKISFSLDAGSLVEVNLQGRIAFLVHEFPNTYEAIALFASRYVHPQDRKAFAVFSDAEVLKSFVLPNIEQKEIPFRRTSYNELFSGYRWSLLSYSIVQRESALVCELLIRDSDKTTSKLAEKTLQTQLDPLTGVLNRSALEAQVTQQIALCSTKECMGAFFMLDIDHFKWVNDDYGHDRGDHVLLQVAQAIRGVFRPSDIIARPGGDEFAVFITGIPSLELAMAKAENMCCALRSLGSGTEEKLDLSCSVGVSIFPDHGTSFDELYHTSDLALYQAKRDGRDKCCLYGEQFFPLASEKPVDREWLFSQLEEEIYLCNGDTYALLFANEALLKRLGLTTLSAKGSCYEVLHQRKTPCKDCMNRSIKPGQMSTRMYKDPKSNALGLVREKAMLLKGDRVIFSITTHIPEEWGDFLVRHYNPTAHKPLP